jgi:pyridoxal phosphate enzyme (YggS family)
MISISDNLKRVRDRIARAAARSGRSPDDIHLVAVTKTVGVEEIQEAIDCGVSIVGESRVQDALAKHPRVKGDIHWHLVGHLQRNKVKKAVEVFELIHSVDSYRLAEEIGRCSLARNRPTDILVQVNTSGEDSKFGLPPNEVLTFLGSLAQLQSLRILGLMTIGAFSPESDRIRPCFRRLRDLFEEAQEIRTSNVDMRFLSMGMSNDFELAIEEGANMVRIGTAIFHA